MEVGEEGSVSESPSPQGASAARGDRAPLPRDLSIFLVQFSIALHKTITYPPDHPVLESSVQAMNLRLSQMLQERGELALGVIRNQLVVAATSTDPANALLRGLAETLRKQQLGAIRFLPGIGGGEITSFLRAVAGEGEANPKPLGLETESLAGRWPHIRLSPLSFQDLEIAGESDTAVPAVQLWLSLAEAALGEESGGAGKEPPAAEALAQAIKGHPREAGYDRIIVDYLGKLGSELHTQGESAAIANRQLTSLLGALETETIQSVLASGSSAAQRKQLVNDATRGLPATAVLELVKASAGASQETISHSLLRILTKLAGHAESGPTQMAADADAALREAVRQLTRGWTLDDPNPQSYRHMLKLLAKPVEPEQVSMTSESDAARIVSTSLEVSVTGEAVWRAAEELVEEGRLDVLVDLVERAPTPEAGVPFRAYFGKPERARQLLADDRQAPQAVDRMIEWMGAAAAEPMLDALEMAKSLTVRRRLLSRLERLGTAIGPLIIPRLARGVWYVQRNMLVLVGTMNQWPSGFNPSDYISHTDARVRREAFKLLFRVPDRRDEALRAGLEDSDEQILHLALAAAAEACPSSMAPHLVFLLSEHLLTPEDRTFGIRALGGCRHPVARDWMLDRVRGRRRWFRRRRLATKSPELLLVLSQLRHTWQADPTTQEVLRLAADSADPEVRSAGAGGMTT